MDYEEFYYPENLMRKVSFFGWRPAVLACLAAAFILSVFLLLFAGMAIPLVIVVMASILTFGVNEVTIYDLLKQFGRYLVSDQTVYFWKPKEGREAVNVTKRKRRNTKSNKYK